MKKKQADNLSDHSGDGQFMKEDNKKKGGKQTNTIIQ